MKFEAKLIKGSETDVMKSITVTFEAKFRHSAIEYLKTCYPDFMILRLSQL